MGAISGLGPNKATLDLLRFRAWNASGGTLTKGTPVYVSGWDAASSSPKVAKADADAAGKRAQFFIQDNDCTNGSGCIVGFTYYMTGANTGGSAVGNPVYLNTTAGGWVLADPSAANVDLQVIGRVHVVDAAVGEIFFNTLIEPQVLKLGSNGMQAGAAPALVANSLSADVAGRGYMQDGYFDLATALAKFATDSLDNVFYLKAMKNGEFKADDATRALWAANFLGATVVGRALMQTGYFTEAKATDAFDAQAITQGLIKLLAIDNAQMAVGAALANLAADSVTAAKLAPDAIKTAVVDIAAADVKLLFGTAYILVAGVAGKVTEFLGAILILNYATTPYDTQGTLQVLEETSGTVLSTDVADSVLFAAADTISTIKPIVTNVLRQNAKGLKLYCKTANPATGDSPIRVIVAYRQHSTGL